MFAPFFNLGKFSSVRLKTDTNPGKTPPQANTKKAAVFKGAISHGALPAAPKTPTSNASTDASRAIFLFWRSLKRFRMFSVVFSSIIAAAVSDSIELSGIS